MSALDLTLSPAQQELLRVALKSNQQNTNQRAIKNTSPTTRSDQRHSLLFTPGSMSDQTAPGSGHLDFSDDSPYLDFGMDGEIDDSFNYDEAGRMIGDLPDDEGTPDLHDKRKSIGDGDDDDDDDDEGGGKRREGDDRTAKKPGRKPLTSEPTTKRKAQNRAAQRAFRERKERHLKDLETKVEDLEKASESTTHENGLLRAQVERLQVEVKEYRKRLSWVANGSGRPPQSTARADRNSMSSNDFSFEFPKFGDLPSTNYTSNLQNGRSPPIRTNSRSSITQSFSASPAPIAPSRNSSSSVVPRAPRSTSGSIGNSPMANTFAASPVSPIFQVKDTQKSVDSLSGLFSPSILQASRHNSTGYFPEARNGTRNNTAQQSLDGMSSVPGFHSNASSNTDSPGSSSEAHQHLSSIGTSPEPLFNSPINKQDLGLQTINESNLPGNTFGAQNFATDFDASNFDWLAQQNGGSFDPVLFGDYRETQDNILSQDFGSFFNDAYPLPDLGSPMHNYGDLPSTTSDTIAKTNLIRQVDAAKEGEELVPGEKSKMLTCNKIWDRLQSMEKFRNGEIDIDNLCSELRSKAKCSEGGAVVDEKHVNKILGG